MKLDEVFGLESPWDKGRFPKTLFVCGGIDNAAPFVALSVPNLELWCFRKQGVDLNGHIVQGNGFGELDCLEDALSSVWHVTHHEEGFWAKPHFICSRNGLFDFSLGDSFEIKSSTSS